MPCILIIYAAENTENTHTHTQLNMPNESYECYPIQWIEQNSQYYFGPKINWHLKPSICSIVRDAMVIIPISLSIYFALVGIPHIRTNFTNNPCIHREEKAFLILIVFFHSIPSLICGIRRQQKKNGFWVKGSTYNMGFYLRLTQNEIKAVTWENRTKYKKNLCSIQQFHSTDEWTKRKRNGLLQQKHTIRQQITT